ncbi:MAG TPA: ABC transporter permease [Thermoanaerobaculia bacterium]|nr:ABC transporter permease [Thermoanaerobaculia bacterium]
MNAKVFAALLRRDITVARRQIVSFLIRTTMQPLLFVTIFGFVLPRIGMIPRGYTTAMLPGVLALSLTLSAIMSVALPMTTEFGYTNEIEDRLLAPVPTSLIALTKIVSGTLQGILSAAFVLPVARLIMGPIEGLTFANAGVLVLATIFGGAAFSALGLWLGSAIPPQQVGLMFSIVLAPMVMFGCAYYPWRGLDRIPVMKYAVLVNPVTYVSEGLRAAITPGVPHMNVAVALLALAAITGVFTWAGLRAFFRRALS